MKYFYEGRCEIPDFAALAVLESQQCHLPVPKYENYRDRNSEEYKRYMEQVCTSRYRILRILDAASESFRKEFLEKEYLEAKESPILPYYRHRPILIFGKHKNGAVQIEGYEETREYFDWPNSRHAYIESQEIEFLLFLASSSDIYALHSIGSPYYDAKNLDRIDTIFYFDYLLPNMKREAEAAERDFSELLQRLTHNRTPVKVARIKNNFAALGTINSVRPVSGSKQVKFYELNLAIETIIKNKAKIKSDIAIYIDKARLPPDWRCPLECFSDKRKPFYLFGDLKDGDLVIEQLASTRDAFVFGDTIYDISMGIHFEELVAYFLPSNMSFEEYKFDDCCGYVNSSEIWGGISPESLASKPDSLRKAITKWAFIVDNKLKRRAERLEYLEKPFFGKEPYNVVFRCRKPFYGSIPITEVDPYYYSRPCERCEALFTPWSDGVWGRKW